MCKTYTQTRLPDAGMQVHILPSPSPGPSGSPTLWPTSERAGGKAGGELGQDTGSCIFKNPKPWSSDVVSLHDIPFSCLYFPSVEEY